jgi:hypothetical protein
MKVEKKFPGCSVLLFLFTVAGCSLAPSHNNQLLVASEPPGAEIYVMGKRLGLTPKRIDVDTVYPVTYSPEDAQYYGQITLRHDACNDKTIMLSIGMISDGLKAKLDCQQTALPETETSSAVVLSVKQRLEELKSLKQAGLISEKEYIDIRLRILDSL